MTGYGLGRRCSTEIDMSDDQTSKPGFGSTLKGWLGRGPTEESGDGAQIIPFGGQPESEREAELFHVDPEFTFRCCLCQKFDFNDSLSKV